MEFKIIKGSLPPSIDPEILGQMQEEARRERTLEEEARRAAGEDIEETNRRFIRHLMNFPELDFDLDELLRSHERGEFNVPR